MKNQWRILSRVLLGLAGLTLFAACSESAGSGGSTSIPQVVINCTTPRCYGNTSPVVHVLITPYNCDPVSDGFAVASSSLMVFCTATSGCYGTASTWINGQGQTISTVSAGTYTVCGRIDYNNNYPGVKTDDTMSIKDSVTVSSTASGPVHLTVWTDP